MNARVRSALTSGIFIAVSSAAITICCLLAPSYAVAQSVTPEPATDTSKQASPASSGSTAPKTTATPAVDTATEASPVSDLPAGTSIAAHTALAVKLTQAVSSATVKNGDTVRGSLTAAVKASHGRTLAAGTAVKLTVVAVAPAGKISSAGEVTLQVIKVGSITTQSNEMVFRGQRGTKELPDSAPAKGAEAMLAAGTVLNFEVIPSMPAPATGLPDKPNIASPNTVPAAPQH